MSDSSVGTKDLTRRFVTSSKHIFLFESFRIALESECCVHTQNTYIKNVEKKNMEDVMMTSIWNTSDTKIWLLLLVQIM